MLTQGMTVKTSYGTGPYIIDKIMTGCTCPSYTKSLNGDNTPSKPHTHITCRKDGERAVFYLNGHDDAGKSVWNDDYLIFETQKIDTQRQIAIQLQLF